jgi:tetratricopeptide (TPR) repeat protein
MGTVFEAFEEKMHRRVALKVLSGRLSDSEKAGNRFAREAWIAGKLSHPNLVKVFERGELADVAFYSMELVDGGSLHDVIRNLKARGRDDTWSLVFGSREYVNWAIVQTVAAARGLDYAHRQGVVHRDVKPMNILLNRDPCMVKVADFGLALDTGVTRMTTAGTVLGTVAYMAPEQIRGRQDQVSARTDVYSLGVTLFELLTLDLPFSGATQQLYMNAVLTLEAKRPRRLNKHVGRDLEVVLRKTLEKDPGDRYTSAAAFADDLENVLHFRPIHARPPRAGMRILKWARRRPMHATLAATLVLGLPTLSLLSYRAVQHRRLLERLETDRERGAVRRLNHDERFLQALPLLDRILLRHPNDLESLRTRAITQFRLAQEESDPKSRSALQDRALEDAGRLIRALPTASWPYRVRALFLRSFGNATEAEQDERSATRYRTVPPSMEELEIDGTLAMNAGEYENAVKDFTEVITRQPDAAETRLRRAWAFERLGDDRKAMTDYEVAAALRPSDPDPQVNLARLLDRTGDLGRGEALLRQVLEIEPMNALAYENLADNLIRRGKLAGASGNREQALKAFREAETSARRSLQLDGERAWARLDLGVALVEQSRLSEPPDRRLVSEAAEEYRKVIAARDSGKAGLQDDLLNTALVNQCDALVQLGDLERALDACRRIADRKPDDPTNHYNLAAVYALSHRSDEAIHSLERDVAAGDRDFQYLSQDKWFESLRRDPRFRSLLARMKKAAAAPRP